MGEGETEKGSTNRVQESETKPKEKSKNQEHGEHGVRSSDKISNLKFHRNFTILGSKLIVLSTGTFQPPPPVMPVLSQPLAAFHVAPALTRTPRGEV